MIMRTCIVDGCDSVYRSKGYCNRHYQAFRNYGDPEFRLKPIKTNCFIHGCNNKKFKFSFCKEHFLLHCDSIVHEDVCCIKDCSLPPSISNACQNHYARLYRKGSIYSTQTKDIDKINFLQNNKNYKGDDCVLWPYLRSKEYGQINFGGVNTNASRVMCILAHGQPPNDGIYYACHSCGNPPCVNPNHLRWDTPKGNQKDRIKDGTDCRGDKSKSSKLTYGDVVDIRLMSQMMSINDIASLNRYNVSKSTIRRAIIGVSWANVPNPVKNHVKRHY